MLHRRRHDHGSGRQRTARREPDGLSRRAEVFVGQRLRAPLVEHDVVGAEHFAGLYGAASDDHGNLLDGAHRYEQPPTFGAAATYGHHALTALKLALESRVERRRALRQSEPIVDPDG